VPATKTAATGLRGGVDLGGTKIQAAVVDDAETVLGSAREPTPREGGPQDVADAIAETVTKAAHAAGVEPADLAAVGVGSPGTIDAQAGTVSNARNLPGWEGSFPLATALERALGTRVVLGHDVQLATNAEFKLGAGRPYDSLLGVFWGTGVGGGLILDGRPWHGRGGAGEIGHMVVELGGRRCTCGRDGCMEAYAGRLAMELRVREDVAKGRKTDLLKIMEERGRTSLTSGVWARALDRGDKLASHRIDRAIEALGAGIASAVNLLDVEAVVIGGGMGVRLGEPYVRWIADAMVPHLFIDDRPPAVHLVALGDLGGAIGAALLAREAAAVDAPAPAPR
jgi:glucokinase